MDWLSSSAEGLTVGELAEASGVGLKTIRRDLILLRQVGFDVEDVVEEFGRKRWRIKRAMEGEPQLFEWIARKKSGELFWIEVNLKKARIL